MRWRCAGGINPLRLLRSDRDQRVLRHTWRHLRERSIRQVTRANCGWCGNADADRNQRMLSAGHMWKVQFLKALR